MPGNDGGVHHQPLANILQRQQKTIGTQQTFGQHEAPGEAKLNGLFVITKKKLLIILCVITKKKLFIFYEYFAASAKDHRHTADFQVTRGAWLSEIK